MKPLSPCVNLLKNKKTAEIQVQRLTEDPKRRGLIVSLGAPEVVSLQDLQHRGDELLRDWLRDFSRAKAQPSESGSPTAPERTRPLRRDILLVSIREVEPGVVELDPMSRDGGGWIGAARDERLRLDLTDGPMALFRAIDEAFKHAC